MNGSAPIGAARPDAGAPAPLDKDARLRRACAQLEGVFLNQLMKVMRETVPQGGALDAGAGQEMFNAMLDENIADTAAERQTRGLGAALYRQLRARFAAALAEDTSATAAAAAPTGAAPEAT